MKFKFSILVMMFSLMLAGCSSKSIENDNLQNNSSKNNEVQESIDSDKKEIDESNKVDESNDLEEEKNIELKIYTADVDDTEKIVELKTISIKEDSTLYGFR